MVFFCVTVDSAFRRALLLLTCSNACSELCVKEAFLLCVTLKKCPDWSFYSTKNV